MRRWLTIHVPILLLVLAYAVITQRDLNHKLDAAQQAQQDMQRQYDALKLQEEREDQAVHRLAGENRDLREALAQERARRAQDRFALLDARDPPLWVRLWTTAARRRGRTPWKRSR